MVMVHSLKSESIPKCILYCFLTALLTVLAHGVTGDENEQDSEEGYDFEALKRSRIASKPWYTHRIKVGDAELPFSPVTVTIAFLSVFYLFYYWSETQSFADAAHILLKDHSEASKKKLEGWKTKIGKDFVLFSKYAKEHSACPSKRDGGNLGRFRKNDMAAQFDRAVFDPNTPLRTTIGPIQTQFGWHLIYVHDRKIAK